MVSRRRTRTRWPRPGQNGGDLARVLEGKKSGRGEVYMDVEDWNKHRDFRSDSIAERNRASAGFWSWRLNAAGVIACVIAGPTHQREKGERPERGRCWAAGGPARCARARGCKWAGWGWPACSLFFNKAFSFFFSLVLKLKIKP